MEGIRLNKVAKELNVGIPTLVEYLSKKGYQIKANPNTRIDETQYKILETAFKSEHDIKIKANESDISNIEDGVIEFSSLYQGDSLDFKEKESDFIEKHYMKLSPPKTVSKIDLSQFELSEIIDNNKTFSVGEVVSVCVSGFQNYGAFVQILNGPSGLIPNKEISWNRVNMASEYVSVGDVFLAKITNIREDGKLALSRREMLPNAKTVAEGDVLYGQLVEEKYFDFIVKISDFTALLPKKEVRPYCYEVGDNICCVVISNTYDEEKHRNKVRVSEKMMQERFAKKHTIGDRLKCRVEKVRVNPNRKYDYMDRIIVSCDDIRCDIHKFDLMEPYNIYLQNGSIKVGDVIEAVYERFIFKKVFLSMDPIKEERSARFASTHMIGDHVLTKVEDIVELGKSRCLLVSVDDMKTIVPQLHLIEPYKSQLKEGTIQIGETIELVYTKYIEDDYDVILDMRPILNERITQFVSTHAIGEHVDCVVEEIKTIGKSRIIIVSVDEITTIVSGECLIEPYLSKFLDGTLIKGNILELVFTGYTEKTRRITLDMRPILKEREDEKLRAFRSTLSIGDIRETEVIHVDARKAVVRFVDSEIEVTMSKEQLSPNKVLNATDEVFVGEHVDVQLVGDDNGGMVFSRQHLLEDKYDDELYDMDVDQLLETMDIHTRIFVGKIVQINDNYFLWNPMSASDDNNTDGGKLLVDPVNGKNLVAFIDNRLRNLVHEGDFYKVELNVSASAYRRKQGTPYMFCVLSPIIEEVHNPYEETVTLSFKKQTSPSSNTSLANLLEEVGINLYSGKKRMFFELLQNADDAAAQNGVKVKVQLNDDYFTLTHDGYSFNKNDFDSIISAAKSTKSANKKKTGYKGIGFKSVFTNSTLVSIKSGGFSFSFDKGLDEYNDFSKFYFHVNDIESDPRKQAAFLKKYEKEAREFNGVKDIPWQLLPIWSDRMTIPYANSIFNKNENVAIALKMDNETLAEYGKAVEEVFGDPRFMLFLRKTKRVQLMKGDECWTIQKNVSKGGNLISLVNSFNPQKRYENFRIFTVDDIPVNDTAFSEAGVNVHREERINTRGEKEYYFARIEQDTGSLKEITGVPDRIASTTDTAISFAIKLDANNHIVTSDSEESSFYAYLPMNENRFSFPFFVNADFIPNSDRERINSDNPWNHYLFYILGRTLVKMVSEIASLEEPEYLNLLCEKPFVADTLDTKQIVAAFNKGYEEAMSQYAFILDDNGDKICPASVIYDDSGLSEAIGHDGFYTLTNTDKRLPHPILNAKILKNETFGVSKITTIGAVKSIEENIEALKQWIMAADEKRAKFFEWIVQKKEAKALMEIVPAYQFSEEWISHSDFTDKMIILSESTVLLRNDLEKLGFLCSSFLYEEHPFHDFITIPPKKKLFSLIKECDISDWSFEDRKNLFLNVVEVLKPDSSGLGDWIIFRNQEEQPCPLSQMFQYTPDFPVWLNPYMVSQSEYCEEMSEYVIAANDVFSKVVIPNVDEILTKTNIVVIYGLFSQNWQNSFTKQLFSKDIPRTHLLYIVEQSNDTIKLEYVRQLEKLELYSAKSYEVSSDEYRIIRIAASTDNASSLLRNKIYIDGVELNKYAVRDEVSVIVNEQRPPCMFLLSELLPSYSSASQLTKVSKCFEDIPCVEKIFAQRVVGDVEVKNELLTYLSNHIASLKQFCFMMIFTAVRTKKYTFDSSILYHLRYGRHPNSFVEVLDECYQLGVGKILGNFLKEDYGRELFPEKIYGTYIDSDEYTLPRERIPEYIQTWADTEDKKRFLFDLGIHDSESNEIIRRKSFKDGKLENIWNVAEPKIIEDFLDWIIGTFALPLTNEKQVTILKGLCKTYVMKCPSTQMFKTEYMEEDISDATEWTDTLYQEWRKNSSVSIWIVEKEVQYRMYYRLHSVLYLSEEDDFMYFPASRRIYVSMAKGRTPAVIMADVYSKKELGCPFTKDDWDKIFRISVDKYQELEYEKEQLESEKKHLKSEIERLRGLLEEAGDDAEVKGHGREVDKGTLSVEERREINREARYAAKEFLERNEDFDCSAWDPDDNHHLVSGVIKYKGNPITVAVTSSMARKLHLHPRVFAELMQDPDNVLLNYGADKRIHSLSFDDIFSDNPNVNLIFDTDVVSPQRIADLANGFMGSKRTCFVIENPNYSQSDSIKHFGLNEKKTGFVNVNFTDDEIFDFEIE
jgi:ribosomal protein S1